MTDQLSFCDLMCRHAERPKAEALDGAGSCRTFKLISAIWNLEKVRNMKELWPLLTAP
jgi:hypothetical protein